MEQQISCRMRVIVHNVQGEATVMYRVYLNQQGPVNQASTAHMVRLGSSYTPSYPPTVHCDVPGLSEPAGPCEEGFYCSYGNNIVL